MENFMDVSQIPLKGNSNDKLQMRLFRMADRKTSRLVEIREPLQEEKEVGVDVVFVREFIGSGTREDVQVSRTNKEYFAQFTKKNAKRADILKEENLEDASLWCQSYTCDGKTFKYNTGMRNADIQRFLKELTEVATIASEKATLRDIEEDMKVDLANSNRLGLTIEAYYERYHPDRIEWLEQEKKAISAVASRRNKK